MRWMGWLAFMVFVAGCASVAPGLPAGQQAVPTTCLPDGFPPMGAWKMVAIEPHAMATDRAGLILVLRGEYLIEGRRMHVTLTPFGPALIDPAPDDATVPIWINLALMTDAALMRVAPDAAARCVWRSLTPTAEHVPAPAGMTV